MSMEALLLAVKGRLQSALSLDDDTCDVQPDGAPEAMSGEWYYAVHPLGIDQTGDQAHYIMERYSVGVTVTRRATYAPQDRAGSEIVAKRATGLYAAAARVRAALHGRWEIVAAANVIITDDLGDEANGFVEPLLLSTISAPRPQGGGWFSADDPPEPPSGYSVEVAFRSALRPQKTTGGLA
jgi:hypothetical protein